MVESTPMVVGGTKKASNSFEVLNLTVVIIVILIVIVTIPSHCIVLVIFVDRRTVGSLGLINWRKSDETSVQLSSLHLSFIVEANTLWIRLILLEQACDLRSLIYKQVITVDGQSSQSQHVIDLFGAIKCSESQSKRTKGNYWIMVNSWSATKEIQSIYSSASRQASSFFLHHGLYNFLHPKISFLLLLWSSSPFQTKWCATTKSSTLKHYLELGRVFCVPGPTTNSDILDHIFIYCNCAH